jgi:hypothetical protein
VTEGGADEQVMVRYYGLYANAHRGKVRKTRLASSPLRIVEEELLHFPAKGWAEMIRKVYEEACPDIRLAAAGAGRPGPFVACRRRP